MSEAGEQSVVLDDEPRPAGRARSDPRVAALVTGAAYGALLVFGSLLGLYEAFGHGWSAGPFPLAVVLICPLNVGVFWAAGLGMGTKLGALAPFVMWLLVVMILAFPTSSGSLVITGSLAGNAFVYGGTVAGLLAIVLAPSSGRSGNWLLLGAGEASGDMRQKGG